MKNQNQKIENLLTIGIIFLVVLFSVCFFTSCKSDKTELPRPEVSHVGAVCLEKSYEGVSIGGKCSIPQVNFTGSFMTLNNVGNGNHSYFLKMFYIEDTTYISSANQMTTYLESEHLQGLYPLKCDSGQFIISEINNVDSTVSGTFWGVGTSDIFYNGESHDTSYSISGSFDKVKWVNN